MRERIRIHSCRFAPITDIAALGQWVEKLDLPENRFSNIFVTFMKSEGDGGENLAGRQKRAWYNSGQMGIQVWNTASTL
jgi:hypothetical protein